MLKKINIIILVFLFSLVNEVYSCSCAEWHSFTNLMEQRDIIVLAKVNQYLTYEDFGDGRMQPMSMEIIVENLVKGNEYKDTLLVWGDNGMLCAPYVDKFPIGTEWMFALGYINDTSNSGHNGAVIGDYSIGGCGDVYLEIIDSNAVGYIFEEENIQSIPKQTYDLSVLIDIIQGNQTDIVESPNSVGDFVLNQNFPNPFNPSTKIEYSTPISGNVSIKIYNLLGVEVGVLVDKFQQKGSYSTVFEAKSFPSGVYMYRLFVGNELLASKKMMLIK